MSSQTHPAPNLSSNAALIHAASIYAALVAYVHDLHQNSPVGCGICIDMQDGAAQLAQALKVVSGDWQAQSLLAFSHERFTKRYDLAILLACQTQQSTLVNTVNTNQTDTNQASMVHAITKLRDVFAKQVLVVAKQTDDLLPFGFERLSELSDAVLWQFNILTYKHAPDWLNAKHWANPENWNKYRW